ncbi:MAG: SDR family NAD(P)-dependent oxidoreductase [Kiritimatiellae bacterium]|nr:SDR family NAD(P)-dependent oxidoreductase [Kiritimatiellia bacterium]
MLSKILPALRGVLAENRSLPRLIKTEAKGDEPVISITPGSEDVYAEIKQQLPASQSHAVTIAGYGTYAAVFPVPGSGGRAAGKIAVVTGAAQGFGYEIACSLAGEGGWVALADINEAGVQQAVAEINRELGREAAIGVTVNVADVDSLSAAIESIVKSFGGIDLFISNAGVLRAGSVKTLSERDLNFVTDVNYKGYFFSVQAVAPIMALQHQGAPDIWSDIIQINSKSGLVGSNKNGAYAGSKFGGIGLTQSFALELVADGIKVNSICPGNFYDGPLWSDPVTGLFKQYLDSGKVPGAKTFDDVKAHYEAQVPMRRGCTTPDVMKAIFYLMEQSYETGQALPVTGGQVMLS